jgi:hypothetical protein
MEGRGFVVGFIGGTVCLLDVDGLFGEFFEFLGLIIEHLLDFTYILTDFGIF